MTSPLIIKRAAPSLAQPFLSREQIGLFRLNLEGAYSLAVLEDCYDVGAAGSLAEAYFLEFA